MPTKPQSKPEITMVDAQIAPVESRYSPAIASVRATLVFATAGRVTSRHERLALATAHRLAADFLEAFDRVPGARSYTAPTVEVTGSFGEQVHAALSYELVTGEPAEVAAITELLHDIVPAPEGR